MEAKNPLAQTLLKRLGGMAPQIGPILAKKKEEMTSDERTLLNNSLGIMENVFFRDWKETDFECLQENLFVGNIKQEIKSHLGYRY